MSTISVSKLGKAYKKYPTHWARLAEWMSPGHRARHELHWVLHDINFIVNPGEAVGIIGMNGAGKSTLLKMITGTTRPTMGSVNITGRVAALLELGMGFHPDFSGRQNVYMAGQLLGYNEKQISQLMPDIEAFADIGEYLDQPVRVYSSGMQMRLAFSVATAQRPEVLIVDEALSVGDAYFQHKSFARIREFREQGSTLLIVSHDRSAIQTLCDRAILLKEGTVVKDGAPEEVFDLYNALIAEKENSSVQVRRLEDGKVQTVSGSGEAAIVSVSLHDSYGRAVEYVSVGESISLRILVRINIHLPELVVGYVIKDRLGQPMYGTNTYHLGCPQKDLKEGTELQYNFNFQACLGTGTYSIATALHTSGSHLDHNYEWRDYAVIFDIVNVKQAEFVGSAWLPPNMELELIKTDLPT
jgi:lipopolysaccharide transport system ATP-binding protein